MALIPCEKTFDTILNSHNAQNIEQYKLVFSYTLIFYDNHKQKINLITNELILNGHAVNNGANSF